MYIKLHQAIKAHLMKRVGYDEAVWMATNITERLKQNKNFNENMIMKLIDEFTYRGQEKNKMKQVIYATTSSEAMALTFTLSKYYAVLVANNEYDSDKDFEGVIIYDKSQTIYKNI